MTSSNPNIEIKLWKTEKAVKKILSVNIFLSNDQIIHMCWPDLKQNQLRRVCLNSFVPIIGNLLVEKNAQQAMLSYAGAFRTSQTDCKMATNHHSNDFIVNYSNSCISNLSKKLET